MSDIGQRLRDIAAGRPVPAYRHHFMNRAHENKWRRWMCDWFGSAPRFSVADLHAAYARQFYRPLPLTALKAAMIGDYMTQLCSLGYLSEAPGPRGGKGWKVERSCAPKWVLEFVGNRMRRTGRYKVAA